VPADLRPRTITDMLDAAFRLYRSNFLLLIGIAALIVVPFMAVYGIGAAGFQATFLNNLADLATADGPPAGFFGIIGLLLLVRLAEIFIAVPAMFGALINACARRLNDQPVSLLSAYRYGIGRIGSLVVLMILIMIVLFALTLCLIVPLVVAISGAATMPDGDPGANGFSFLGSFFLILVAVLVGFVIVAALGMALGARFAATPQAIVLEGLNPFDAIQRSLRLTEGSFWRVFLLLLAVLVLYTVLSFSISAVLQVVNVGVLFGGSDVGVALAIAQVASAIVNALFYMLLYPLVGAVATLLYYDLLIRREGGDFAQRVQEFAEG
jgi:hypothetical protein